MRATIETHESSRTLPPIKVMVALGGEDLSIKVGAKYRKNWFMSEISSTDATSQKNNPPLKRKKKKQFLVFANLNFQKPHDKCFWHGLPQIRAAKARMKTTTGKSNIL